MKRGRPAASWPGTPHMAAWTGREKPSVAGRAGRPARPSMPFDCPPRQRGGMDLRGGMSGEQGRAKATVTGGGARNTSDPDGSTPLDFLVTNSDESLRPYSF